MPFADFRRIKVKIVEGCSPAPTLTSDSTKSWQRTIGMSPPPAKYPKRLSFEHVEDDSYAGIMDYKSPIELDTGRKKNSKISCIEKQLEYYDTEYVNLSHDIRFLDPLNKENSGGNVIYFKATEKVTVQIMCGDVSKHLEENAELRDLAEKKSKIYRRK